MPKRLAIRAPIEQLDAEPPELLLADVRLQDGDGFDLLAYSRKKYPQLPVILLTGYGTSRRVWRRFVPGRLTC